MRRLLSTLRLLGVSVMALWVLNACTPENSDSKDSPPGNLLIDAQLSPTGCETYIGAHPIYPGELLCCSAPAPGSVPECGAGDTPDIACVMEYQFCDNGFATMAFSPNPASGQPGHGTSTSGSWVVNSVTGELTITTSVFFAVMNMTMDTVEKYPHAFVYDSGNKLDLHSLAAVSIDKDGIGTYNRHVTSINDVDSMFGSAHMEADTNTNIAVTVTGYSGTKVQNIVCTPADNMICKVTPPSEVTDSSGTHSLPIHLFKSPAGKKMYQTNEAKVLVFERQSNLCAGIECGEHGFCGGGACICTHGYSGEFCEVADPCANVVCGGNESCFMGSCVCDFGFEGESCVDINECDPNPCLNGSSCTEGSPGTYTCSCADGYAGVNCETCSSDTDRDGYGDPTSDKCTYPLLDCDDTRVTVYPGAPELCDGVNNQCSGDSSTDEGYSNCGSMVQIIEPGLTGTFSMGDNFEEGWTDERPVHSVTLSAFEMDRHEITNAEYAECVNDSSCDAPSSSGSYSRTTYYGDASFDDFPVIWMTWKQVDDYCNWAGKRLPTEAEWEYAARGGLEGKRYPWGDDITSDNANYGLQVGDTSRVEFYAPNSFGLFDMAGNVWEWVADWFNASYYSDSIEDNPKGATRGVRRVSRGGSFDHSAFGLRVAGRCDFCHIDNHGNNLGGRCAR